MTKLMSRYSMSIVIQVFIARLRPASVRGFGPIRTGIARQKFEYRNFASFEKNDEESFKNKEIQDEFHKKIRKQVDELPVYSVVANDFTAWIKAIQNASILELGSKDPWTDNETLIQVRRMRAQDLESQVDLPESEHEYEDYLDVIKLPLPITIEKASDAPQFLFIRPDEYALFKCFGLQDWCILTGNPGISKSWFQWKFILFCYRPDLFDKFSPFKEKLLEGFKTEDQTSTEQEQVVPAKPFIPKLIVRTVAGSKSLFFFVGLEADVQLVEHTPQQLDRITDEHTTILWEPGSSLTPVYYEGVKARIIATVSNEKLFHEFNKRAEMLHMPCPSELQIRLMGQIYQRFATYLENCPTDEEICERLRTVGPFIQIVLCWSTYKIAKFKYLRRKEIETIVRYNGLLQHALESPEEIMLKGNPSHRLVRYVVQRDSADRLLGYAWEHHQFSCKEVLGVFSEVIAIAPGSCQSRYKKI